MHFYEKSFLRKLYAKIMSYNIIHTRQILIVSVENILLFLRNVCELHKRFLHMFIFRCIDCLSSWYMLLLEGREHVLWRVEGQHYSCFFCSDIHDYRFIMESDRHWRHFWKSFPTKWTVLTGSYWREFSETVIKMLKYSTLQLMGSCGVEG